MSLETVSACDAGLFSENAIENPTEEDVCDYLDEVYPDKGMRGHRQQLYAAAYDISCNMIDFNGVTTKRDAMIMRMAWECSRAGQPNIASSALGDALGGYDRAYWENVADLIRLPGFLTDREKWHSARLGGVTVYRGCSDIEIDAPQEDQGLGYSWTLDRDVAEWFAHVHLGKVITARLDRKDAVWLDTAESEVIWPMACVDVILAIEPPAGEQKRMDWDTRRHITPLQAKK